MDPALLAPWEGFTPLQETVNIRTMQGVGYAFSSLLFRTNSFLFWSPKVPISLQNDGELLITMSLE